MKCVASRTFPLVLTQFLLTVPGLCYCRETGTFQLEVGVVDIWELMRKTLSEFAIQARNRKVSLNLEIKGDTGKLTDEESGKRDL